MKNSVNNAANMVSNSNYAFMAFGKGAEVKEFTPSKKYEGFGVFEVLGVNLNKAELEALGFKQENEPVYVAKDKDGNESIKLDFVIKSDADKNNGIELLTKATFWISGAKRVKQDGSKMQVIDSCGNTAWVTPAEFQAKSTILTKNDGTKYQGAIFNDYRGIFEGEEEVTNFIKTYLQMPATFIYKCGVWEANAEVNPSEAACSFEESDIINMMKGNFSAVKNAIAGQPNKRIKMLLNIKTVEKDGKQLTYQDVFTRKVLYPFSKKYDFLTDETKKNAIFTSAAGYNKVGDRYYKNGKAYYIGDIREYNVEATSFDAEAAEKEAPKTNSWGFGA